MPPHITEEIPEELRTEVAATPSDDPPPLLDPPAGTRNGWLAEQLAQHAFVVMVFYRGYW